MGRAYSPVIRQHERRSLQLPPSGRLRLGVVADTHSRPHPATLELLRAQQPDHILHAGDVGDLGVLDALADLAPVHPVRGNIDSRVPGLPDALTLDVVDAEGALITLLLTHIAITRGRLYRDVRDAAAAAQAALVVCGHSHIPFIARDGALAVYNPGSCGPRRFDLPILIGTIDISEAGVDFRHVDCETGLDWRP